MYFREFVGMTWVCMEYVQFRGSGSWIFCGPLGGRGPLGGKGV